MYTICENIRIKTCDDQSFFVDISNNLLFNIKTDTLKYLLYELDKGLSANKLKNYNSDFVKFICDLESLNILTRYPDEN